MLKGQEISNIEQQLQKSLQHFQHYYTQVVKVDNGIQANNQVVIPKLIKILGSANTKYGDSSYRILEYLLQFLDDPDIMSVAATSRVLYRLIYSPLGFRFMRYLRPIISVKGLPRQHSVHVYNQEQQSMQQQQIQEEELPHFTQSTVDQLCSDRNIQNADEDDKMAILLTMRTNILATKQKIRQLEQIIYEYERRSEKMLTKVMYIGGSRQHYSNKIDSVTEEIEKLKELLKATSEHQHSLREEQQRLMMERQQKMLVLNEEKRTRERQKDLLIKKIKSQQKQREEGMIYAREVDRILSRLAEMTTTKSQAATNRTNGKSDKMGDMGKGSNMEKRQQEQNDE